MKEVDEINLTGKKGWSLFEWAADFGQLEVCRFIIEEVKDKNPDYQRRNNE